MFGDALGALERGFGYSVGCFVGVGEGVGWFVGGFGLARWDGCLWTLGGRQGGEEKGKRAYH